MRLVQDPYLIGAKKTFTFHLRSLPYSIGGPRIHPYEIGVKNPVRQYNKPTRGRTPEGCLFVPSFSKDGHSLCITTPYPISLFLTFLERVVKKREGR